MPVPSQVHYGFHSFPVVALKNLVIFQTADSKAIKTYPIVMNKGNNKITELRTILQRESQNS
jgi:hypothetical protein